MVVPRSWDAETCLVRLTWGYLYFDQEIADVIGLNKCQQHTLPFEKAYT
jgi:hypothetical protein